MLCMLRRKNIHICYKFITNGYKLLKIISSIKANLISGRSHLNDDEQLIFPALPSTVPRSVSIALTHWGLVTPHCDVYESTLFQVMSWCVTAPSHYRKQFWIIFNGTLGHSKFRRPLISIHKMILKNTFWNVFPHLSIFLGQMNQSYLIS